MGEMNRVTIFKISRVGFHNDLKTQRVPMQISCKLKIRVPAQNLIRVFYYDKKLGLMVVMIIATDGVGCDGYDDSDRW